MIKNAVFVEQILSNKRGAPAQVGYDLTIKDIKYLKGLCSIGIKENTLPEYLSLFPTENKWCLNNGVYSCTFNEGGKIPPKHAGIFKTRSSLVRCGVIIESGLYDPNFECLNFGAMVFINNPHGSIIIEKDSRVAQLLLFETEASDLYNGQYQGEKDKK